MPQPYHAEDPMPADQIVVDARVYVPIWQAGEVIGWDHGTVLEVRVPTPAPGVEPGNYETSYLVKPDNGETTIYYGWSIGQPRT